MAIMIASTASGYQHALSPQELDQCPKDSQGRRKVRTVCAKVVVAQGPIASATSVEEIRCRPCKSLLYKGRAYQATKG